MLVTTTRKKVKIIQKNNPDARIKELGKIYSIEDADENSLYRFKIRGPVKNMENIEKSEIENEGIRKEHKIMAEIKPNPEIEKKEGKLTGVFNDMILAIISSKVEEIENTKKEIIALRDKFDAQILIEKKDQASKYLEYTKSAQELISTTLITIKTLEGNIKNVKESQTKEYKECTEKLNNCNAKLQKIVQHFKNVPG